MHDSVYDSGPEKQCCPTRGVDAGEVGDDHKCCEGWEILDKVEVCSLGSLSPRCRGWRIFWVGENIPETLALNPLKYIWKPQHYA